MNHPFFRPVLQGRSDPEQEKRALMPEALGLA
jgi:hypothetical protein